MTDVDLPHRYAHRAATLDDVDAIVGIANAAELHADGIVDVTASDIESDLNRPSLELSRDTLLVLDGDDPVAYADVNRGVAWVQVHPDHTSRGLGTALLGWSEARAREHGSPAVGQTISDGNPAAGLLLRDHGYDVRWETWLFQMPLDPPPPPPRVPEGLTLRSIRRGDDEPRVHEVIETAFSEWPERDDPMSFEDWKAAYVEHAAFEPDLCLLLEEGDRIVGVSLCLVYDDEGWVQQLAVARSHRGRGLASTLLRASFQAFRERGLRTAGLSTESRTGARGIYEHVGLRVVRSYRRWSKPLP